MKDHVSNDLDRELDNLPGDLRWREWMRRIEAVLFASAAPVPREDLARVVGQGASVDLLVEDLAADLEGRAFELARVAGGWILRTRPAYASAIRVSTAEQNLATVAEQKSAIWASALERAAPIRQARSKAHWP